MIIPALKAAKLSTSNLGMIDKAGIPAKAGTPATAEDSS
jgi:hypothetical protein